MNPLQIHFGALKCSGRHCSVVSEVAPQLCLMRFAAGVRFIKGLAP
jgi:hypothetical protein